MRYAPTHQYSHIYPHSAHNPYSHSTPQRHVPTAHIHPHTHRLYTITSKVTLIPHSHSQKCSHVPSLTPSFICSHTPSLTSIHLPPYSLTPTLMDCFHTLSLIPLPTLTFSHTSLTPTLTHTITSLILLLTDLFPPTLTHLHTHIIPYSHHYPTHIIPYSHYHPHSQMLPHTIIHRRVPTYLHSLSHLISHSCYHAHSQPYSHTPSFTSSCTDMVPHTLTLTFTHDPWDWVPSQTWGMFGLRVQLGSA